MPDKPYTSRDVAERLGVSVERFYLRRRHLELIDKMPPPIASSGRHAWHRGSMDAWLERHHPNHRGAIANDNAPLPAPVTIDEHREHLHRVYGAASTDDRPRA